LGVPAVHSRHLQPARFPRISGAAIKSPEQKSPLVGSSFERGLGKRGLFGFLENSIHLTTDRIPKTMAISPFKFLQEVRSETAKVTWPTRRETTITTIMVFVMVALASIFFFAADQIIRYLITLVLGIH
jgi:preprotein translocase subunit SecE